MVGAIWSRAVTAFVVLVVVSCRGGGSDIGPEIPEIGSTDYRVLVQDDAGRHVTGALVTVSGHGSAASGRLGRARINGRPNGFRMITVDGTNGSAVAGDQLGVLTFGALTPDGDELPYVVHLPDLSPSAPQTVSTGALPVQVVLDGVVTFGAGTVVGAGAVTSVTLRTGALASEHLPGDLPVPVAGARLWGAGRFVDPVGVTFSPGGALSLPNDLGLAAAALADLYHLDTGTGAWTRIGIGTVDGTGTMIDAPVGSITGGGLFAFATTIGATTSLSGRIVDNANQPIPQALVAASGARTRSLGDGSWFLPAIAATDGAGVPRTVTVEVNGGRDWRPTRVTTAPALTAGMQVVPDVVIETTSSSMVRMQLISRGRVEPFRAMRLSASEAPFFGVGVGNREGYIEYDDVPANAVVGLRTARVKDASEIYIAEALALVPRLQHHVDFQVFYREQLWWTPRERNGATRTFVADEVGHGPIRFAAITAGAVPGAGHVALTEHAGAVNASYGTVGQATASIATGATGLTVHSAFTFVDSDSAIIEIPLERARRSGNGGFDRHGLVSGQITGATVGKIHRVRTSRVFTLDDWYEEVFEGHSVLGNVPLEKDPMVAPLTEYTVGVPAPDGHFVAVEGVSGTGTFALERLGFRPFLAPVEGSEIVTNVPVDLPATTNFAAPLALLNLHPSLAVTDLAFDLAIELSDGTLIDAVRGVDGNASVAGNDVTFALPALTGTLAGGRHLLAFGGEATSGGVTVAQHTFIPFSSTSGPTVRMLDVPDIVSPAVGATVPASGFSVQFTVPISTLYTIVELRSTGMPGIERVWKAVLPASIDTFTFRDLPPESADPLEPGSYTLEVRAARIETGILSSVIDAYRRALQNWIGIGPAQREVNAYSSTKIDITLS